MGPAAKPYSYAGPRYMKVNYHVRTTRGPSRSRSVMVLGGLVLSAPQLSTCSGCKGWYYISLWEVPRGRAVHARRWHRGGHLPCSHWTGIRPVPHTTIHTTTHTHIIQVRRRARRVFDAVTQRDLCSSRAHWMCPRLVRGVEVTRGVGLFLSPRVSSRCVGV